MIFDIITIFPQILDSYVKESIIKRAVEKNKIKVNFYNLRDWTRDKHKTVDDKPYGGGPGMIMKVDPIYKAVKDLKSQAKDQKKLTVLLSADGKRFNQKMAYDFLNYDKIIFICGRYEGVDERVARYVCDEKISIGNYVLTGGELPAMVIIDVVTRLIPGVLGNKDSLKEESYSERFTKEYPQYTTPQNFKGWKVPKVLLSGNHKKIKQYRKRQGENSLNIK
ncbi:MAG: tRNA (guanosine(37)-N1)-methyltransferase TrmD [Candidatus Moranbacteria bacterium]|nr:tRNA (guanosine(37)-N1)-methyltransferase TrmD [Candidatus Moranbacteria bacterium]